MSTRREVIFTITCDRCPGHVRTYGERVEQARAHVARFGWRTTFDDGEVVDVCPNHPAPAGGVQDDG